MATDIRKDMFTISVRGKPVSTDEVLPDWTARDRLGIVTREAWETLGASLLMQLAALLHYEARPERRTRAAQYPQIYVFHVGRMHGDHSSFDVWPPRHEILVEDDPAALLAAINDRAITRLVLPDVPSHGTDFLRTALNGWTDESVILENLASAWAYSSSGTVDSHDLKIESSAEELERMSTWALAPEETFARYAPLSGKELVETMQIGPSSENDLQQWLRTLKGRVDETPAQTRRIIGDKRRATGELKRIQTFRSLSTQEALRKL
ncbi:hypothetical protein ACPFL9_01015 [Paenarthrobacter sp. NyZ202]|uniref:hypothetical protein n=1 Tax=Paenarthrobacter sp. NyZ202 TaxID=3402689 RepID=UPI003CEE4637